jgi:amidase
MGLDLWHWSAGDLTKAIRARQISSREAVESCLARNVEVHPRVNAVVDLLADEALADADKADAAVRAGEPLGPLHGVPVTVKINVDYAGRATTNGVAAFKDLIAREDSVPILNLRKSGAIIFGRTNVPAFSTRYFTDNDLYGRTLNPHDPTRTPGGSSGGAAAAVAVGIGPIAHGNDRAGSIRYPAYACGVAGLRPTIGRVPDFNPSNSEERGVSSQLTNVQGPLARTVADLRLGLAALAAFDPRDPWWSPAPLDSATIGEPAKAAMFVSLPDVEIDPAVAAAVRTAAGWLEDAGYVIEEAVPPRFLEAAASFWTLLMTEERAASSDERAASSRGIAQFGDEAVKRARASTRAYAQMLDFDAYIKTLAARTTILREWLLFLQRYPVLLMPVSWQRPFPIDADQHGDEPMRRLIDALRPLLVPSILGLPGLAVPTGLVDGVPMGVQLVASRFREATCLRAGEIIEMRAAMTAPIEPRAQAG